jgi:hypothetical protein
MKAFRRLRVSPAMGVACVALLIALGGSSFAAVQAVLPSNSVGQLQLRNSAVSTAELARGAVTTGKLAANAVTSAKVKNGSLLAADFKAGQLAAGPAGPPGPPGPPGAPGQAGTGATLAFKVITSPDVLSLTSNTFADVAGATTTIDVPSGASATLLARFTAESACYGGGGYCSVRILVDGNEAAPAAGTDFAFDSSDNNTETVESYESHTVERSIAGAGAGSHTVTVQVRVSNLMTLRLDDWSLSILALKQ